MVLLRVGDSTILIWVKRLKKQQCFFIRYDNLVLVKEIKDICSSDLPNLGLVDATERRLRLKEALLS